MQTNRQMAHCAPGPLRPFDVLTCTPLLPMMQLHLHRDSPSSGCARRSPVLLSSYLLRRLLCRRRQDGSLHVFDDFREAYSWLRHNTPEDAKVYHQPGSACIAYTSFSLEKRGPPLIHGSREAVVLDARYVPCAAHWRQLLAEAAVLRKQPVKA